MAALRLSSACALPNPRPFFCSHQRLGSTDSQKGRLGKKRGLRVRYTTYDGKESRSGRGRNFDTKPSCLRSTPVPRGSEVDLGSDKPGRLSVRKTRVQEAVEPSEKSIRTTPGLRFRDDELCHGSNNSKKPTDLRTDGRPFRRSPVPLVPPGKKSGGRSSDAVPAELVRVLDLYEELNGNKGKAAWNLRADPTHNVIPSAGAASQTRGYHSQGLSRNSYGISASQGRLRSRGVGLPMVRVSGRSLWLTLYSLCISTLFINQAQVLMESR
jgi:hypothetical protein